MHVLSIGLLHMRCLENQTMPWTTSTKHVSFDSIKPGQARNWQIQCVQCCPLPSVWGAPLCVGNPSGCGESLWVWGVPLGMGSPSGCGEYLWVLGIPLGVGNISRCGESLWVRGVLLGVGSPSGYMESFWPVM